MLAKIKDINPTNKFILPSAVRQKFLIQIKNPDFLGRDLILEGLSNHKADEHKNCYKTNHYSHFFIFSSKNIMKTPEREKHCGEKHNEYASFFTKSS